MEGVTSYANEREKQKAVKQFMLLMMQVELDDRHDYAVGARIGRACAPFRSYAELGEARAGFYELCKTIGPSPYMRPLAVRKETGATWKGGSRCETLHDLMNAVLGEIRAEKFARLNGMGGR